MRAILICLELETCSELIDMIQQDGRSNWENAEVRRTVGQRSGISVFAVTIDELMSINLEAEQRHKWFLVLRRYFWYAYAMLSL